VASKLRLAEYSVSDPGSVGRERAADGPFDVRELGISGFGRDGIGGF
jgi:hypothetical protein